MDNIDQRLLEALVENSRISVQALAKLVGVSREVANYRLKNLRKSGVIQGYRAIVNSRFTTHALLIRSQHDLNILRKYPQLMGRASGWDALLTFSASNREHLSELLQDMMREVEQHCLLQIVRILVSFPGRETKDADFEKELDKKDIELLRRLYINARATNKQLAKGLGLTPEAVAMRVSRLEKAGVIEAYTLELDWKQLDIEPWLVLCEFKGAPFLGAFQNSLFAAQTVGQYDVLAIVDKKDIEQIRRDVDPDLRSYHAEPLKSLEMLRGLPFWI